MPGLPAQAQGQAASYPSRPVRLVVPFPAGSTDSLARIVAQRMSVSLGQSFVVENMPGASGNIGAGAVAKAAPDGHTLVMVSNSIVTSPLLGQPMTFNPAVDLVPVGLVATAASVLVTRPGGPFRNVPELVAFARANPGQVTYASAGNGTLGHLYAEWFKSDAGVDILHVPYKGGGPALIDVIGGQVHVLFDVLVTTAPQVRAGKLQPLAITSAERSPMLPDVPTMSESGYPGFHATAFFALMAPAATPRHILDQLSAELGKALAHPEVRRDLANLGMVAEGGRPEQFGALYARENERWSRIIKSANIRVN
ncbi:MAG: Bug family tripartite tricarboxylate transporter substrate binding protein [Lautropia sp.]